MNGRYIIFSFILFIGSVSLFANNKSIKDYYNSSYRFDIFQNETEDEMRNNYILQQIAFDNSITFSKINLNVDYTLAVEIKPASDRTFGFQLQIEIMGVNGDVKMKKFDVSKYLHPDLCSFDYRLFDRVSGREFKSSSYKGKLIDDGIALTHLISALSRKEDLELEFSNLNFYFSEKSLEDFKSHVSLIENYYAITLVLSKMYEAAENWRPDNERDIVLNYFRINEFERLITFSSALNFHEKLNLSDNDPAGFTAIIKSLNHLHRRLNTLLSESLRSKQLFLPNVAVLSTQIVDSQQSYAKYLDETPYSNNPLLSNLSVINYPNAWFADILNFFSSGLTRGQKSQLGKYFEQFVIRLRKSHLHLAQEYLDRKNYEASIIQCDNASGLNIASTPESQKQTFMIKSQAITGLYKSYMSIANRATKLANIEMARLYMKKASDFHAQYEAFITEPLNDTKPDLKVIDALVSKARMHKTNQQYPEASKLLLEAMKLCKSLRVKNKEFDILAEIRVIYKLESYRIMELNDSRLLGQYQGDDDSFTKEVERLKADQLLIMNQLERLDAE